MVGVSLIVPIVEGLAVMDIQAEWLPGGRLMRLLNDIGWKDKRGRLWIAEKGFITDGASIPQVFWAFLGSPFTGQYRFAAVLHDYAYQTLGVSKADADFMLIECSLSMGCPRWIAESIYLGVQWGGEASWKADQVHAKNNLNEDTLLAWGELK